MKYDSKILQEACRLIHKDKRVAKTTCECFDDKIVLWSTDGFYLTIKESKIPQEGPVLLETNGDSWIGDYADISMWINRHAEYLGGKK